jgi:hypothetical protein
MAERALTLYAPPCKSRTTKRVEVRASFGRMLAQSKSEINFKN